MTVFFIIVLFALVLSLFVRTSKLRQDNAKLIKRIQHLEKRAKESGLFGKASAEEQSTKPLTKQPEQPKADRPVSAAQPPTRPEPTKPTAPERETQQHSEPAAPVNLPPVGESGQKRPEPPSQKIARTIEPTPASVNPFWANLEKQLIENWTGILGSVIMVMGVGFLGIYAALKLTAFYRFLMISGFAGALFGCFLYLRTKVLWVRFGLWMRSSAAAIFLFACLGSGGIEGLQWIDDPTWALVLLLFGIATNLALSWVGGKQVFASLHVLLSVVALLLVPQDVTTLIIAAVIALVGILLTYREKWDYHLLLTISTFFAYHLFWYFKTDPAPGFENTIGIITVLCISITAAFVHYRGVYASKTFDTLPFAVHVVNWLYFGLGLMMHSTGSQLKTFIIAAGAIAAFFLARYARKLGIRWLYQTDTLTAQLMMLLAIITLNDWELSKMTILVIGLLELLLFSLIMAFEREEGLYRIGTTVANIFSGLVLGMSLIQFNDSALSTSNFEQAFYLTLSLVAILAFHGYTALQRWSAFSLIDRFPGIQSEENAANVSLLAIQAGVFILFIHLHLWSEPWIDFAIGGAIAATFFLRQRTQSIGLLFTNWLTVVVFHVFGWYQAFGQTEPHSLEGILCILPLLGTAFLALMWPKMSSGKLLWPGIYLLSLDVFLGVYYLGEPTSQFLLPCFSLAAAAGYFLLARWLENRNEGSASAPKSLIQWGFIALALFLFRHFTLLLNVPAEAWLLDSHEWMAVLGLGVLLLCASLKSPLLENRYSLWANLHPLLTELSLFFFVFTIAIEVDDLAQPLVWGVSAFALLILGHRFDAHASRLKFYSVIAYWMTAAHSAYLTCVYVDLDSKWLGHDWLSGLVSILLLFGFIGVFYPYFNLQNIRFPRALQALSGTVKALEKHQNAALLYPLTACVTIFLYWSFDKSLLTLLWVLQSLAVFILSLVTKQQQFRYVALTGLGFCVLRLIFYDLAQAGTLTKALVFLGVGIIMLAMNWLYTKYKGRFSDAAADKTEDAQNDGNIE